MNDFNAEKGKDAISLEEWKRFVRSQVIEGTFLSPYGQRQIIFTDHTASNQAMQCVEDYIQNEVLPFYGNTHTLTSVTGLQTTRYREEAREVIRNATNASEHDAVIFCGNGVTGAINRLVHALCIQELVNRGETVTIIHGPHEHHSNILPWRESGAIVLEVQETRDGGVVDLENLEDILRTKQVQQSTLIVGSFAAMSNVTGIPADILGVTALLHKYNALSCWDYATGAAYMPIDMNPLSLSHKKSDVAVDAIFLSPHKLTGGINSPGILIAKKKLYQRATPCNPGGGSVIFVTHSSQKYFQDIQTREEAGTPDSIGSIRAGLSFKLLMETTRVFATNSSKQEGESIPIPKTIFDLESRIAKKVIKRLSKHDSFHLLGSQDIPRAAIFSFMVFHKQSQMYIHHNFVSALLNDMFGIQTRGGCACAGPYTQLLLGLTPGTIKMFEDELHEVEHADSVHLQKTEENGASEMLRPGFVRLNFPWFMSEEVEEFVLQALEFVLEDGWKLLPFYTFKLETGEWRHKHHTLSVGRKWLNKFNFSQVFFGEKRIDEAAPTPPHEKMLEIARSAVTAEIEEEGSSPHVSLMVDNAEKLRWFLYPEEALWWRTHSGKPETTSPFIVRGYPGSVKLWKKMDVQEYVGSRFKTNKRNNPQNGEFVKLESSQLLKKDFYAKDMDEWSVDEVNLWMQQNNLDFACSSFLAKHVSGVLLVGMEEKDLETSFGLAKYEINAFIRMRQAALSQIKKVQTNEC
eukprot:m.102512 g.102512  ORF g.102512 m.102512 type:complete len:746 (-) comp9078_c0_seq8:463-2700(-)